MQGNRQPYAGAGGIHTDPTCPIKIYPSEFILLNQKPSSSPTSTTLIFPAGRLMRVRSMEAQMLVGFKQSDQVPVRLQGLSFSKRWTLIGAAMYRARASASSIVLVTLFMPATTITLFGPKTRAATRLPLPSML